MKSNEAFGAAPLTDYFRLCACTFTSVLVMFVFENQVSGQEFDPQVKNDPPEFTTAIIDDGILKFVAEGIGSDYRTGVEEVMVPKTRLIEKPVTIQVPYQVEKDGQIKTLYRSETRIEKVEKTVMESKLRTKRIPTTSQRFILHEISLQRKQFQFMTVDGKLLDHDSVRTKLEEWTPAILLRNGEGLSPYFKKLLNPEIVVLVEKKRTKRPRQVEPAQ